MDTGISGTQINKTTATVQFIMPTMTKSVSGANIL